MNTKLRTSDDDRSVRLDGLVKQWRKRVRQSGEYVSLADMAKSIAKWCALESGSVRPSEQQRLDSYWALEQSLVDGEFEEAGRSRVVYPEGLYCHQPRIKMTRQAYALRPDDVEDRIAVLDCFLIPRHLARRWFEDRRIPLLSWLRVDQTARGVEAGKVRAAEDVSRAPEKQTPAIVTLKPATNGRIMVAIREVYAQARQQGAKPPNLREIAKPVQQLLKRDGYSAFGNKIEQLAGNQEFASLRRGVGKRVNGSLPNFQLSTSKAERSLA